MKPNLTLFMRGTLALTVLVTVSACTPPPQGGSGVENTTATGWKEGYGGDSIALEAVRMLEKVCFRARGLRKNLIKKSLNTEKEVGEPICDLLKQNELVIESVEQPKVNGIEKDAANYPEARPRRLEIKKAYWTNPKVTEEAREDLLLHEVLPLVGLEDKDYVRSSRLRVALQASYSRVPELVCEQPQIQAILSGATSQIARFYSREMGKSNCRLMFEVMRDHQADGSFDLDTQNDLQQAFGIGLVYAMARTTDEKLIAVSEMLFMESGLALGAFFGDWSTDLCREVGSKPHSNDRCGGVVEFMAGADFTQKMAGSSETRAAYDFDRAVLMLMHKLRATSSSKMLSGFLTATKQIDPDIVRAAIRMQNWPVLNFLGLLQRDLNNRQEPSWVLLKNMNWRDLLEDSIRMGLASEDPALPNLQQCSPIDVMKHTENVVNGGVGKISCEFNFTI